MNEEKELFLIFFFNDKIERKNNNSLSKKKMNLMKSKKMN